MKIAPVVETYDRIVREVKSDIVIVGAGEFVGGNKTPVVVKAIWDTGAYGSVISPKVASELGLTPVGVKPIQTANGSYEAYAYVVAVVLFTNFRLPDFALETRARVRALDWRAQVERLKGQ